MKSDFYKRLEEADPALLLGIKKLIDYDYEMSDLETGCSEISPTEALLDIISALSFYDPFDFSMMFDELCDKAFGRLGYDTEKAKRLLNKMRTIDEGSSEKEVISLLRDMDGIYARLSYMNAYPTTLVEALSLIEFWFDSEYFPSIEDDLIYILSLYKALSRSGVYTEYIERINYTGYKERGFLSPDDRTNAGVSLKDPEIAALERMLMGK